MTMLSQTITRTTRQRLWRLRVCGQRTYSGTRHAPPPVNTTYVGYHRFGLLLSTSCIVAVGLVASQETNLENRNVAHCLSQPQDKTTLTKIFDGYEGDQAVKEYRIRYKSLSNISSVFEHCATHKSSITGKPALSQSDFMRSRVCRSFYYIPEAVESAVQFSAKDNDNSILSIAADGQRESSEYLTIGDFTFLTMLLSVPEEDFQVAFKLFDSDSNGNVDCNEFRKVRHSITVLGSVKGDTGIIDEAPTGSFQDKLERKLFGTRKDKILSFLEFRNVVTTLKNHIREFEYHYISQCQQDDGNFVQSQMTAVDLQKLMLGFTIPSKVQAVATQIRAFEQSTDTTAISAKEYARIDRCMCDFNSDILQALVTFSDGNYCTLGTFARTIKAAADEDVRLELLKVLAVAFAATKGTTVRATEEFKFDFVQLLTVLDGKHEANHLSLRQEMPQVRGLQSFRSIGKYISNCVAQHQ